jgi:hypothetical protein
LYDFGDLITNDGETPDENVLRGQGFMTITALTIALARPGG